MQTDLYRRNRLKEETDQKKKQIENIIKDTGGKTTKTIKKMKMRQRKNEDESERQTRKQPKKE